MRVRAPGLTRTTSTLLERVVTHTPWMKRCNYNDELSLSQCYLDRHPQRARGDVAPAVPDEQIEPPPWPKPGIGQKGSREPGKGLDRIARDRRRRHVCGS